MTFTYEYKNKKKLKLIFSIFISLIVLFIPYSAYGENTVAEKVPVEEKIIEEQTGYDEVKKLGERIKNNTGNNSKEIMQDFDPHKIISDASKGKFEFNIHGLFNRMINYIFKEIYTNMNILIKLVVLVVLCSILKNLQTSFLSESVGELAFYACYIVIVTVMIISLNTAMSLGREIIDGMVGFMHATIPVLITLLVSGGNLTTAGIFQPILVFMVEISATILRNVFLPLIFFSTVLNIVDNISDKVQVSKLAGLLKQVSGWALGLILTVFIAIISIQGSLGAVVDGVTSKTAKFAIGAFIPVAGKYLADAADTVIGCTLLIKNAAGVAVMIGIIALCIVPILKIFALIALYRLTCVIIQPISEKRITNCMNDMANSLTFILGIVASVAFMFLISVTMIIGASNVAAMIR